MPTLTCPLQYCRNGASSWAGQGVHRHGAAAQPWAAADRAGDVEAGASGPI